MNAVASAASGLDGWIGSHLDEAWRARLQALLPRDRVALRAVETELLDTLGLLAGLRADAETFAACIVHALQQAGIAVDLGAFAEAGTRVPDLVEGQQAAEKVWSLYAAFFLLPIVGMGALAVTWTQLLNLWYVRNRGLALALGLSGTGITAAVTRYTQNSAGLPEGGFPAAGAMSAITICTSSSTSTSTSESTLTSAGRRPASPRATQSRPASTAMPTRTTV